MTEQEFTDIVDQIYTLRTAPAKPSEHPRGIVLGGQPGSGKSTLVEKLKEDLPGALYINLDEYRSWHPDYRNFQEKLGKESIKATAQFAAKVTETLIDRALADRYSVIIEGTFRTHETPIKTLTKLKEHGYTTGVFIKSCPAEESWRRCNERYENGLKKGDGKERYTYKEHHDLVVKNLPHNADIVLQSGLADFFFVMDDNRHFIYSSKQTPNLLPSVVIEKNLHPKHERNEPER